MRERLVNFRRLMVKESRAKHYNLLKNGLLHLRKWNLFVNSGIFDQTLDEDGLLGDVGSDFDNFAIVAKKFDCFCHLNVLGCFSLIVYKLLSGMLLLKSAFSILVTRIKAPDKCVTIQFTL